MCFFCFWLWSTWKRSLSSNHIRGSLSPYDPLGLSSWSPLELPLPKGQNRCCFCSGDEQQLADWTFFYVYVSFLVGMLYHDVQCGLLDPTGSYCTTFFIKRPTNQPNQPNQPKQPNQPNQPKPTNEPINEPTKPNQPNQPTNQPTN